MNSNSKKSPTRSLLIYVGMAVAALILILNLSSCTDRCETSTSYITLQPQFASMAALRTAVEVLPPQAREGQGKIYIYNDYLLLGDPDNGIHIYDNRDQENPLAISFINIPGNRDMAVRNGRLYADSYVDLLVFDISDIENIILTTRLEGVFPLYNMQFGIMADGDQIITGYEELETIEVSSDCMQNYPDIMWMSEDVLAINLSGGDANFAAGPNIGIGGSMARFTIVTDFLYAVDDTFMRVYNISDGDNPVSTDTLNLGWGVETIFPFKNNLFIGSVNGMSIYNIDNPSNPVYMSEVSHIRTCDPVVADDNYAFVTLRSENDNNWCGPTFTNELDVIDVTNVADAKLLHVYPMTEPYGLGLDGNILFISEGDNGLKIYDVSDVSKIDENMLHHLTGFNAFDVIPYNGTLILTGRDGLYQFDYSNIDEIKMLSLIPAAAL